MKKTKNILLSSLFLLLVACTEPFPIETIEFENILVVESSITNEMKRQVVKLSRTIRLTDFGQATEDNANVKVEGSDGNVFDFSQDSEMGYYLSDAAFQAVPNVSYTLKIVTQNGQSYTSTTVTLSPEVAMDQVYPESVVKNGKEGVQVFVDTENLAGDARYFRYEYEETYKVRLPNPSGFTFEFFDVSDFTRTYEIELMERRLDLECYSTIKSEGILQISTSNLGENRIFRHPVRFISKSSAVIKERYSILVKQYVQSQEAYTFYQILKDLGNVESLLSQGQPGFVSGNIISGTGPEEKVLGFFEASSVSSQRIYFNYKDFGFELPPYLVECEVEVITGETADLKRKLEFDGFRIFFYEEIEFRPIYHIARSECAECDSFSTHIKPDFWED